MSEKVSFSFVSEELIGVKSTRGIKVGGGSRRPQMAKDTLLPPVQTSKANGFHQGNRDSLLGLDSAKNDLGVSRIGGSKPNGRGSEKKKKAPDQAVKRRVK